MQFPITIKGQVFERMSDDEFFHFCQENSDTKFERNANGEIIIMSPTTFNTGDRNAEIITQLRVWNKKHQLGRAVDSDTGFYLPNGAMRNPDAAWVSNELLKTLPESELDKFPRLTPEFVIELKSKSDLLTSQQAKMGEWMASGCQLGWLIDPEKQIVYIYSAGEITTISGFDQKLSGEPLLPGFELDLSELIL
ncbi:MAG: Uma2 family endonuclease [Cyclobacteriaceae bacterium]